MRTSKQHESMKNAHLHELLVEGLKDMLGAEKQLLKGLKRIAKVTQSKTLKSAFEMHHKETENHIERLKQIFGYLNITPRGKKCKAMEGLLEEMDDIATEFEESPEVLDAALIAAAQKVEHYEIASYGCLVTYANLMEHSKISSLLKETLKEEKETDDLLTKIAMGEVNVNKKTKSKKSS